jgi:hypothetical protein
VERACCSTAEWYERGGRESWAELGGLLSVNGWATEGDEEVGRGAYPVQMEREDLPID